MGHPGPEERHAAGQRAAAVRPDAACGRLCVIGPLLRLRHSAVAARRASRSTAAAALAWRPCSARRSLVSSRLGGSTTCRAFAGVLCVFLLANAAASAASLPRGAVRAAGVLRPARPLRLHRPRAVRVCTQQARVRARAAAGHGYLRAAGQTRRRKSRRLCPVSTYGSRSPPALLAPQHPNTLILRTLGIIAGAAVLLPCCSAEMLWCRPVSEVGGR